ncbi:MAG: COG1361 S-layer family protein [Candidatus Diapherotrites archaeon]|nr:COG1361 S-layer family protein [Candidatus Diapherotrites archaeon]
MNDRLILSIFVVVFCANFVCAAQPSVSGVSGSAYSESILVDSQTVYPSTIHPGDEVTLSIVLSNPSYGFITKDITATVLLPSEFTGIITEDTLTQLRVSQDGTVVFRFKVNDNVSPGTYAIPLQMEYISNETKVTPVLKATIDVTSYSEPDIVSVSIEPQNVELNKAFTISAKVKNTGDDVAKKVTAKLTYSDDYETYILPASQLSLHLGNLEVNEERNIDFSFIVDRDALPGVIPFTLTVEDESENLDVENISVRIIGHPNLVPSNFTYDEEIIRQGDAFSASLELENIGSVSADAVYVEIIPPEGMTAPSATYVGTIDEDDSGTAVIDFKTDATIPAGTNTFTIKVAYRDNDDTKFISKAFSVYIEPMLQPTIWDYLIPIIVIAALGFFGWKWWKRQKELKKF